MSRVGGGVEGGKKSGDVRQIESPFALDGVLLNGHVTGNIPFFRWLESRPHE
jgi:hypothetical protein